MNSPKFQHDSDCCQFLMHWHGRDLYYCAQDSMGETVLARFGDDGPEYMSGICFAEHNEHLAMALRCAMELGLTEAQRNQRQSHLERQG